MKDRDIRYTLKNTILKEYFEDGVSRVIDELGVFQGSNRIDIAVVNGSLHGFEIKSEYDNLLRLPNQIQAYSKVFDYISVIASQKHIDGIRSQIPDWCGIYLAEEKAALTITSIRAPQRNLFIDAHAIVQLLWKDEIIAILGTLGISKGLSNKNKKQLWSILANSLSINELSNIIRSTIKGRVNWRVE